MAKYKIGITEAGDAGKDLSWVGKLNSVDGAVLITKCISPGFYDAVLKPENRGKLIIHATCTGYGRTKLEPYVPYPYEQFDSVRALMDAGFPKDRIVIRVDPIIPTLKGCSNALAVIESFMNFGLGRYRISVIDMYPHVRQRFVEAGLPLPYGNRFSPNKDQLMEVDAMLHEAGEYWTNLGHSGSALRIEACAEPGLKEPIHCGCISGYDLALLKLDRDDTDSAGAQRKNCLCYSGKQELLSHRQPCYHECLYCYWRTKAGCKS